MDKLEKYLRSSRCSLTECLYGDDMSCEDCIERMIAEHDKQIKADAIDECMTILKAHHMIRTCEDDYIPKIERPFYQKLWNRFEQLKEQKNV